MTPSTNRGSLVQWMSHPPQTMFQLSWISPAFSAMDGARRTGAGPPPLARVRACHRRRPISLGCDSDPLCPSPPTCNRTVRDVRDCFYLPGASQGFGKSFKELRAANPSRVRNCESSGLCTKIGSPSNFCAPCPIGILHCVHGLWARALGPLGQELPRQIFGPLVLHVQKCRLELC